MFKGTLHISISIASPLLTLISIALMPQVGVFVSVCFFISFGLFFTGEFIIPKYAKEKESSIKEEGTYLGHLLVRYKHQLKQLRMDVHKWILFCYKIGGVAFVVGLLALVIFRFS